MLKHTSCVRVIHGNRSIEKPFANSRKTKVHELAGAPRFELGTSCPQDKKGRQVAIRAAAKFGPEAGVVFWPGGEKTTVQESQRPRKCEGALREQ